jgi:hypothetical protein
MSQQSTSRPNRLKPDGIIDFAWVGILPDGSQVYSAPRQAVGHGLGWLLMEYPHQTLNVLALGSVAGAFVYFAREAIKDQSP